MPTSVLRRYTPPTCTLEIAATGSLLSRWTDRLVLKQLQFKLSFDDPKRPVEQQVNVRGDRNQLEALCEVVEAYVQNLLEIAPVQLEKNLPLLAQDSSFETTLGMQAIAPPSLEELPEGETTPPIPVLPFTQNRQSHSKSSKLAGINLQPKGLLAHDLCLGDLATAESGSIVRLSTLQLFDLANALDGYAAEAIALPALSRPAWLKSAPTWTRVAAILVLSLGFSIPVVRFVMNVSSSAPTVSLSSPTADASKQEFGPVSGLPAPAAVVPPPSTDLLPLPPPPRAGKTAPSTLPSVTVPRTPSPNFNPRQPSGPGYSTVPLPPRVSSIPAQPRTTAQQPQLEIQEQPSAASAPAARSSVNGENPTLTRGASPQPFANAPTENQRSPSISSGTALDSIPQVAEARSYFQQHWQPPEALTQVLQYRLVVNSNGTIQQIIPLGQASGDFIDRTEMPLIGDPFVSPIESGQSAQIRLVLSPDGRVQTFLEGMSEVSQ